MSATLTATQLEILKLFSHLNSDDDMKEIKSLLITYLSDKVVRHADKAFDDEKKYAVDVFDKWKKEHFRNSAGK